MNGRERLGAILALAGAVVVVLAGFAPVWRLQLAQLPRSFEYRPLAPEAPFAAGTERWVTAFQICAVPAVVIGLALALLFSRRAWRGPALATRGIAAFLVSAFWLVSSMNPNYTAEWGAWVSLAGGGLVLAGGVIAAQGQAPAEVGAEDVLEDAGAGTSQEPVPLASPEPPPG